jgi:hypothetical protein
MTNTIPYTPGPWDCDLDYIVAPDPNGRHPDIYIAEIAHADDEGRVASYEQQHANRQLITAAPELREKLADLVQQTDEDCPLHYRSKHLIAALEDARLVLAKATLNSEEVNHQ